MAKFASPGVYDAALDLVAGATEMYYCEGQPASRADAQARACHASPITMSAGDYAKSNNGGGRRLTIAAKSVTANASRPVDHVALCTGSTLLAVTTCPAQNSNAGASVNSAAWTLDSGPIS